MCGCMCMCMCVCVYMSEYVHLMMLADNKLTKLPPSLFSWVVSHISTIIDMSLVTGDVGRQQVD